MKQLTYHSYVQSSPNDAYFMSYAFRSFPYNHRMYARFFSKLSISQFHLSMSVLNHVPKFRLN